ncbi:MAG: protoheme IX farnesyltransferase [Acidimicrobiia bacterium]|nr:protoheme IX farnesyltransferase [Acidimicrobiia bacterium]MYC57654.1 protoheme IX farnesyltransferase [Acidimicrobiia bacterium]MYG93559.1 protoheme IX farnesyltransferase [Acidimicrobiia bacterium]MYI31224.1 protoheme IX farnesyltransferase [Acidimicrobiia bacterium]
MGLTRLSPHGDLRVAEPRIAHRLSVRVRSRYQAIRAYISLTKPRIIELLLVTTVPAMVVADRGIPSLWLMAATVIGGTLAAGGANAVNMYVDRDIDQLMERTRHRPLVTGEIAARNALVFAITLEAVAFVWFWGFVNLLSAALAVSATGFYVFVYTLWLKRTSSRNIVIGGAAGAVPVLVGWAAVTNTLDWTPLVLFALIFYWTPPHFWALAIRYRNDYRAANVPMLPAVASIRTVAVRIVGYTLVVLMLSVVFWLVAEMGYIYLSSALGLGAIFLYAAIKVLRTQAEVWAMRLFSYSITYITLLFGAMVVDQVVRTGV